MLHKHLLKSRLETKKNNKLIGLDIFRQLLTVAAAPSCGRDRADREIVQLVANRQHKSFHPDCFKYSSIVNAYCDSLTRINLDRPQYFQCVISFSFIITLFISLSQGSAESTAGVERCSLTSILRWGVARCGLARLKSREQQVILMTRHQLHAPIRSIVTSQKMFLICLTLLR